MARTYHLYMMASRRNGTIYTGVTGDLAARAYQHRNGEGSEFTARYGVTRLVYAEEYNDVHEAIAREKAIKKWRRAWKVARIERDNPEWNDLFEVIL